METQVRKLSDLFAQLGESSDEAGIAQFIAAHSPLSGEMQLHEAKFWSSAQSKFLQEAILDDADWTEPADELNIRLHA